MPRLPLVPNEPDDEVLAEVFRRFAEEDREPIWLYRTVGHAPRALRGFSALGRALRYEAAVPRTIRELVILRTAQLTAAEYEWTHHRPMALAAGVTEAQVRALHGWRESDLFDERERAALRCAEEVHAVALTDDAFAGLRALFEPAEVVEIVLTAAHYQAVARVLQALRVEVEPDYRDQVDGLARPAPG